MSRPVFFYATGTAYLLSLVTTSSLLPIGGQADLITVPGYRGRDGFWNGRITDDVFPVMLDPDKWQARKITYPASIFPFGGSINSGVAKTVLAISRLPKGTKFALGGCSQGAAVMSLVLKNYLQTSSAISSRLPDMLGAVMFGNPCRQVNKTWPAFNTYAGGSFSGSFDVANSTTGGHGCFPASYRITNTPANWFEFVGNRVDQVDIVTCVSSASTNGNNFQAAAGDLLSLEAGALVSVALSAAKRDAVGAAATIGAAGHIGYPLLPPPGYASNAPTSYQIALEYLDGLGRDAGTAPIVIPQTAARGWSPRLATRR